MNLDKYLNEEQKVVAETLEGPVNILAGAGSGKTRTLTYRTANLIENGVSPYNILTLTFTNKASEDMQRKIAEVVGQSEVEKMWIGTFHSICLKILLYNLDLVDREEGVVIYDQQDQTATIKNLLKRYDLSLRKYKKPAITLINKAKMELLQPFELQEKMEDNEGRFYEQIPFIYEDYEELLKTNNAFDFNDLIVKTIQLFREHPMVLEDYQERFKYIQIDEFQDTNHSQYIIATQLAEPQNNLFVVGDDWQSIYAFRGADITNILNFEKDFPDAKVFKLERNYRSSKNIIESSNQVIKNNQQNKDKESWTNKNAGTPIKIMENRNPYQEGQNIANEIKRLVEHSEYDYKDMVIFYRMNYQSGPLETIFVENNIPYKIIGNTGFFNRREIKYFLSYLRLMKNPYDILSLRRILDTTAYRVGDKMLNRILNYAKSQDVDLYQILENPQVVDGIGKVRGENLIKFKKKVIDNMEKINESNRNIYEKALKVYESIEYEQFIKSLSNPDKRKKNITELFNIIKRYSSKYPEKTLNDFLLEKALESDQDKIKNQDMNRVRLMTTHTSKGLEFPVVFVVGVEENMFPHSRSIEDVALGKNPYAIEEERRLFYVAMTRAEQRLYLSFNLYRNRFGGDRVYCEPSRFLMELPEDNVVYMQNKEGSGQEKEDDDILFSI